MGWALQICTITERSNSEAYEDTWPTSIKDLNHSNVYEGKVLQACAPTNQTIVARVMSDGMWMECNIYEEGEKELLLQKGRDVWRLRNGAGVLWSGCGIIYWDKIVGWGVATLDDVVWLCWSQSQWGHVSSWETIWMGHQNMGNHSRVPDELYILWGLFGVGGFPYLLSLLVLMYSKQTDDFDTASTFTLTLNLDTNFKCYCLVSNMTWVQPHPLR